MNINNAYDIIKRPILSEKSYAGIESKIYTFEVDKRYNKTAIKQAVEVIYGVSVDRVNTVRVRGKLKRMGKNQGMTPSYKKAIVFLSRNSKSIEFFDSLN